MFKRSYINDYQSMVSEKYMVKQDRSMWTVTQISKRDAKTLRKLAEIRYISLPTLLSIFASLTRSAVDLIDSDVSIEELRNLYGRYELGLLPNIPQPIKKIQCSEE